MDYELAKQLKDAGFAQNGSGIFLPHQDTVHGDSVNLMEAGVEKWPVYVPTLSELIEACGEEFGGISRSKKGGWIAYGITAASMDDAVDGSTPEVAVGRLWLALHTNGGIAQSADPPVCTLSGCKGPIGHTPHPRDLFKYDDFEEIYKC